MKKIFLLIFIIGIFFITVTYFYLRSVRRNEIVIEDNITKQESERLEEVEDEVGDSNDVISGEKIDNEVAVKYFSYNFSESFTLEETGEMDRSGNPDWWVNSGAFLFAENGIGKTIFGDLDKGDKWQKKYEDYNSSETDKGKHPQNIFRLILKSKWENFTQFSYYRIKNYILSKDDHRSESNGILLFNRYQDGDNLYYTGLRVDGTVIVKKKYKGKYYTMAQKPFYGGKYDRKNNPILLPINTWIGVKSEVRNISNNTVSISVFIDKNRSGDWQSVLTVVDDGKSFGGLPIYDEGYVGIRTDFMDVEFDDYKIEEINE